MIRSRRSPGATLRFLSICLVLCASCLPPKLPLPRVAVEHDPAVVARGRYLARHVMLCESCHSRRDWTLFGGPVAPGSEGQGGESFVELYKLPPEVVLPAPNITPAALGDWSDRELARALVSGISRDGSALFPAHPYVQFRTMARGDLEAVIAWVRTLPPGERELPERDLKYGMVRDITNAMPLPAAVRRRAPEPGEPERGAYVTKLASCLYCHSPSDALGFPLPHRLWAGGAELPVPPPGEGRVISPNITRHATGLGAWNRELFIGRFKAWTPDAASAADIEPGGFNSPMAWSAYSGMTEEDLGAIWDYLQSRRPREGPRTTWLPPTP